MDSRVALMVEVRESFPFVFVDSGAHSFFSEAGDVSNKQRQASLGSPEVWLEDYLATVEACHQYADAWAELDIDSLVGLELVLGWRERLSAIAGEKTVPVFHSSWVRHYGGVSQMWAAWEQVCRSFPYVATEGSHGGQFAKGVQSQRRILEKARKHGAKLHGFACTSVDLLKQVHYFSADSVSWLAGSMYGVSYNVLPNGDMQSLIFENKTLRANGRKRILKELARQGVEIEGGVAEGYLADDAEAVDLVHAKIWIGWEETLTRKAASRRADYWNGESAHLADEPCTCDSPETEGACKRHGVGRHGVAPPKNLALPAERKARIAQSMRGNVNALATGVSSPRAPQLRCSDCYIGDRCPKYQEGAVCALDAEFSSLGALLGTRSADALVEFLYCKLELDSARYARSVAMELIDGGLPWKTTDGLSARLSADVALLARLHGRLKTGPQVDARSISLIVNTLGDDQYTDALEALAQLRALAPQLLEAPEEE